jgi:two-component system, sporulation sensor kinase E
VIRKKVKILIVDDRPENLLTLKAILDRPDYELISANSGEEALKWVLTEDFAVILLDIQMPGLDGFETASLIHKRERSRKIPIIFITAIHRDIEQVIHGYSLGAIDYIFKPVNPETLRYKIDGFVRLYIYREQLENKIQEKIEELSCVNKKLLNEVKQRKISEAALKKSEYRFKKLFLDSIMGISLMDSKGRIFESNPALHSILGYSAEELKGHTYSEFLYSTKDQEINIKIQRLVMGESSQYQIEKKFKSKTGQVIWGKLYLSLVRDHNGKIMYVIGMLNDITESKKKPE